MAYRKLIAFGKNSFVVSVPKPWVVKNKLTKGAVLQVIENPEGLMISTEENPGQEKPRSITINVQDKSIEQIRTEIVTAYLKNYDTIEIIAKEIKSNIDQIYEVLRNLAGLEIMEQTSTKIVAKDLININDIDLITIIRRMDIITRAMISDAVACIGKENNHESIKKRDIDVNRLHFLAFRAIRRGIRNPNAATAKRETAWDLLVNKMIVTNIEIIADMQKRISRYLKHAKMKKKEKEDLKNIFNGFKEAYNEVMKAFYNNDHVIARNIAVGSDARVKSCDNFLKQPHDAETARVLEHLKTMSRSIRNIARQTLSKEDQT